MKPTQTVSESTTEAGYPPLLTGEQVARRLNISRAYAYKLIQQGDLPYIRIGRSVRVELPALQAFIERSRQNSGSGGIPMNDEM
jgi:excisionase family DNA binding protein